MLSMLPTIIKPYKRIPIPFPVAPEAKVIIPKGTYTVIVPKNGTMDAKPVKVPIKIKFSTPKIRYPIIATIP